MRLLKKTYIVVVISSVSRYYIMYCSTRAPFHIYHPHRTLLALSLLNRQVLRYNRFFLQVYPRKLLLCWILVSGLAIKTCQLWFYATCSTLQNINSENSHSDHRFLIILIYIPKLSPMNAVLLQLCVSSLSVLLPYRELSKHKGDITWTLRHLVSLATRQFVLKLIQTDNSNKDECPTLRTIHAEELIDERWFRHTKGPLKWKLFMALCHNAGTSSKVAALFCFI